MDQALVDGVMRLIGAVVVVAGVVYAAATSSNKDGREAAVGMAEESDATRDAWFPPKNAQRHSIRKRQEAGSDDVSEEAEASFRKRASAEYEPFHLVPTRLLAAGGVPKDRAASLTPNALSPAPNLCDAMARQHDERTVSEVIGCTASSTAASLYHAQREVLSWDATKDVKHGRIRSTPQWLNERVGFFGVFLLPRLRLVLFTCPKCGNSYTRELLYKLSAVSTHPRPDYSSAWEKHASIWRKENEYCWQMVIRKDGLLNQLDVLLATSLSKWHTLCVVRHPHDRFTSGYSELEIRWKRNYMDTHPFSKNAMIVDAVLNASFRQFAIGSVERVRSFWTGFVLGDLYTASRNGCIDLLPILYHLVPIAPGYWRAAAPGRYLSAEHTIDVSELYHAWPMLLKEWGFDDSNNTLLAIASQSKVYSHQASVTSQAAKDLLAESPSFRKSVNAFYAQDFACFGYTDPG